MKKTILLFLSVLIANFLTAQVWTPVLPYVTRSTLIQIHFPTKEVGYAVGSNYTLLKSTDGGNTWKDISFESSYLTFASVFFIDEQTGYIADDYKNVYYTDNGGKTWEKRVNGLSTELALYSKFVWFQNRNTGYVGGRRYLFKTTDEGKNWEQKIISEHSDLYFQAIGFQNTTTGYAVGAYKEKETFHGLIMKTTDGGNTWKELNIGDIKADLSVVTFVNEKIGYIGGGWYDAGEEYLHSMLLKTEDGGKTWKKYSFRTGGGSWTTLCFLDEKTGYACMDRDIYKTTDGGESWEKQGVKEPGSAFYALSMFDYDKGIAVGLNGLIGKLEPLLPGVEDGGIIEKQLPYPNPTKDRIFLPCTDGYAATAITIYNALGTEIANLNASNNEQGIWVDVSSYPAGTYFYRCGDKNGKFTVE